MVDSLLSVPDIEEELSLAYVGAVAARAGYTTAVSNKDRDGVDIEIQAGGKMSPALGLQLKATINLGNPSNGEFRYELNVTNYKKLIPPVQTPRLLVVLALPRKKREWLTVSTEKLVLRRCAYWLNLHGRPETTNKDSITVSIPEKNVFDVETLRRLMDQSRRGRIIG